MMTRPNVQRSFRSAETSAARHSKKPSCLCVQQTLGHANFRTLELPNFRTSRRAFTLIETALAMLAIGLGLLALFGLGRLGLQSTKETENDQRCVQMADAVFETLRDYNARFVINARTNVLNTTWIGQWSTVINTAKQIPFPLVAHMSTSENLFLIFANEKQMAPAYDENALSLNDWNPRYTLALSPKYTDISPVAGKQNLLQVTFIIYPDGDTYSSEYRLFHTTLSDTGGLQ